MEIPPQVHLDGVVIVRMRLMSVVPDFLGRGSSEYNRSLKVAALFRGGAATVRERLHRGPLLGLRLSSLDSLLPLQEVVID